MAGEANKVRFGLSNVHIFPIQKEEADKLTYGEVFKMNSQIMAMKESLR